MSFKKLGVDGSYGCYPWFYTLYQQIKYKFAINTLHLIATFMASDGRESTHTIAFSPG